VTDAVRAERWWRALRFAVTIGFSEVGVFAGLTVTLAQAGVGVFALSTFDTDYLLVREHDLGRAVEALT
jgi:hypothetical protein